MQRYEYRVLPAPKKGKRAKGVKGTDGRFAHALTQTMNQMAADGWEYLRADTLPAEERAGLTSKTTSFQTLLVFRRDFDPETVGLIEDHSHPLIPEEDDDDVSLIHRSSDSKPEPPLTKPKSDAAE
ncbi:DUF4177 domain-containing protein [Maritimibacter dapengensis]|uniref:DUF4177 domain-containing protein n=1 Tax=Maritimibacter dapengensis TaxID=2836868 RepID=A0ABS6T1C7_9RHOB|nr:DUF4177 domain-containing protein [Maritimibacter dapengensis]MBV7379041.1 DUF4177 domain-containing protein [Maritimibacter dapengensis]